MKEGRCPRRLQGHALIGFLITALVWGAGATGLVKWTVWLLQSDRAAIQSRAAAQALQTALELGSSATLGAAVDGQANTRSVRLPDGSAMLLTELRRSDAAGDPARGAHITWSAQWEDPWGQRRSLVLHSFWAATRRIY